MTSQGHITAIATLAALLPPAGEPLSAQDEPTTGVEARKQLGPLFRGWRDWDVERFVAIAPKVRRAIELNRESDPRWAAGLARTFASSLARGRPRLALEWNELSGDIADSAGDDLFAAQCLVHQIRLLNELSEYDAALQRCDVASRHILTLDDNDEATRRRLDIAVNRSTALLNTGRWIEALNTIELAATTADELHTRTGRESAAIAQIAIGRGVVLARTGQLAEALRAYERALPLLRQDPNPIALAIAEANIANVHSTLGRLPEAAATMQRVAAVFDTAKRPLLHARALANLALVQLRAKELTAGLAAADQAIVAFTAADDHARIGDALRTRAAILGEQGDHAEARAATARARAIFERHGLGHEIGLLDAHEASALLAQRQIEAASAALDRAEERLGATNSPGDMALVHCLRGELHGHLGNDGHALSSYAESAARIVAANAAVFRMGDEASRMLRERFGAMAARAVAHCAQLDSPSPRHVDQAYAVVQALHGLGTADALANFGEPAGPQADPALRAELEAATLELRAAESRCTTLARRPTGTAASLRARLTAERAARTELRSAGHRVERLLERQRVTGGYASFTAPTSASLANVRASLAPNTCLIEFVVDDATLHAFAITANATRVVTFAAADVNDAVTALGTVLDNRQRPSARELRRVGRLLLDPILEHAPDNVSTLLFAPRGRLCMVPFELLLTADAPADPKDWPYLIQRYVVGYVPSGTSAVAMRARGRDRTAVNRRFVGLGDPRRTTDRNRERLPHSAVEVLSIAGMFASNDDERQRLAAAERAWTQPDRPPAPELGGQQFTAFLGDRATEGALRSAKVREATMVHLACHAELDTVSPRLSKLVLAEPPIQGATDDDGYLHLGELRDLALHCEILVLSSCASAIGPTSGVDGMISLSQAGLAAGADSVVSTLWAIPDHDAAEFMRTFYSALLAPGSTRLQAMTIAKRQAIARGESLLIWSAYVLWDAGTGD